VKKRTVVFVGTDEQLYNLSAFPSIFQENDWVVHTCNSISEARRLAAPDLLIVWGYLDFNIESFGSWKKHPKTIWVSFSPRDQKPTGVKSLGPEIRPTEIYKQALQICK
jgi:hypothetical protein